MQGLVSMTVEHNTRILEKFEQRRQPQITGKGTGVPSEMYKDKMARGQDGKMAR